MSPTSYPLPASRPVADPEATTPVEERSGRLYKRDDLHRHPSGVNGGKWRQCTWLVGRMAAAGATEVASGASILSPQLAMTAVAAAEAGLECTLFVGTRPESAVRQPSPALAVAHGARLEQVAVGYNPALQRATREHAERTGARILHYGVTPGPEADLDELRGFHGLGGRQALDLVQNGHPGLRTLIVPFGSANSGASILWGLASAPRDRRPRRVVLVGIGPSRLEWLWERLAVLLGPEHEDELDDLRRRVRHVDLHGTGVVRYADRVRWVADGIPLHPTYEAKVARWAEQTAAEHPGRLPGWAERDGTACLWIIGAPVS